MILHDRWQAGVRSVTEDENLRQAKVYFRQGLRSAPSATSAYLLEKVPIIQWLPKYSPTWLFRDVIAGLTIGILVVPQSLAYAKVANIPQQYGLISSWLPMVFYVIFGTSKDVTSGPTAIMALLTGSIVTDLVAEGYSAQKIATATTFFVGIYSLALGLLKLGFLLDFISLPVLTGYVSAAALTIVLGQVPTLFGETGVGSATGDVIHDFFQKLPATQWRDLLIGFSGVVMLSFMQFAGRRWGKKYRAIWYLSLSRNALALVLFTGISYGVNKGLVKPLFAISQTTGSGIQAPTVPDLTLLRKVSGRSIPVFVAAALEHLAIGKSFGRRHNYVIDQSQELFYIGFTNLFGSFFSAMPITGGFSRTAVNSESGVKSPLSGLVTSACVLVSIYKLADAFYWIPKATLAAIIITAVWQIIIPVPVFYKYWKTSFADFIASMVSFWVTLFVSVEIGIAAAVAYSIVYVLLRLAFVSVTHVTSSNIKYVYPHSLHTTDDIKPAEVVPEGTQIFKLHESLLFPNANRIKSSILDTIYTYTSGIPTPPQLEKDRLWNASGEKYMHALRTKARVSSTPPLLQVVILDFNRVARVDLTGIQALVDLKADLRRYGGDNVQVRFVGLNECVRKTFERGQWGLRSGNNEEAEGARGGGSENKEESNSVRDGGDMVFDVIQHALVPRSRDEQFFLKKNGSSDIEAAAVIAIRD